MSRSPEQRREHPESDSPPPGFEANWAEQVNDFQQMGLRTELERGVFAYGFKTPSEVQAIAIKPICDGRSVIAQAQAGTGKTCAYGLGLLNRVEVSECSTQALVIANTRELATQIYDFMCEISKHVAKLEIALFVGGHDVDADKERAELRPHVVVGTPGRLLHLMEPDHGVASLSVQHLHMLCLDNVDALMTDDFLGDVSRIVGLIDPASQLMLFGQTIPQRALSLLDNPVKDPVKILVDPERLMLEGIHQFYVEVPDAARKRETLLELFGLMPIQKCVIFANKRDTVNELAQLFKDNKFLASSIHGDMSLPDRDYAMAQFREGSSRVMIATDLIARAIAVQQVTIVFNFELPRNTQNYGHRVGRSGRYGRNRVAISLCDPAETRSLDHLRRLYDTEISQLPETIADIVRKAAEDKE